jgi:hypothetical protein
MIEPKKRREHEEIERRREEFLRRGGVITKLPRPSFDPERWRRINEPEGTRPRDREIDAEVRLHRAKRAAPAPSREMGLR